MILYEETILIVPFLFSLIYVQVSSEKGKSWKVGVGGTGLILVQTKVLYPTGPLLTIQENYCATAHIHSSQAILKLSHFLIKHCDNYIVQSGAADNGFRFKRILEFGKSFTEGGFSKSASDWFANENRYFSKTFLKLNHQLIRRQSKMAIY